MIVSGIVMFQPERKKLALLMQIACEKLFTHKGISTNDSYAYSLSIVDAYIEKFDLEKLTKATGLDKNFLTEVIDECDEIFTDAAIEKVRFERRKNMFKFLPPFTE